jgi:group I intron endonuclease
MKTYEVYKITNKLNNKIYIGITSQGAGVRYYKHLSDALHGSPFPIHNALRKYGKENFTLEIIELCETSEILKEREKYWIAFYNSTNREIGYNMTEGGNGTFGRLHSEETKEKIRQKALGRKASEETKRKLSQIYKQNYSEAHRKAVAESNAKRTKAILMFDRQNNLIKEYPSLKLAASENHLHVDTIRNIAKGKSNGSGEYIFKYKEVA